MNLTLATPPAECEQILLRQFDDDCRPGLPTPPDVAHHLATCSNCHKEWQQRDAVETQMRAALSVEVPMALYRRAYHAAVVVTPATPPPMLQLLRLLFAALVGASCMLLTMVVPYLNQWPWLAPVAFLTAAALTYLFEFAEQEQTPTL